jgi:hypothetical protein
VINFFKREAKFMVVWYLAVPVALCVIALCVALLVNFRH